MRDKSYRRFLIGQEAGRYLRALRYAGASTETLNSYETVYCRLALRFADFASLEDLVGPAGKEHLREFLDREWGECSEATRRVRLTALSSLAKWAVAEGRVSADFTAGIRAPRARNRERQAHPPSELRRLIVAQPLLRDQCALGLLCMLGLAQERASPPPDRRHRPNPRTRHDPRERRHRRPTPDRHPRTQRRPLPPHPGGGTPTGRIPALPEERPHTADGPNVHPPLVQTLPRASRPVRPAHARTPPLGRGRDLAGNRQHRPRPAAPTRRVGGDDPAVPTPDPGRPGRRSEIGGRRVAGGQVVRSTPRKKAGLHPERPVAPATLVLARGGGSSAGRAPGCGPGGRGFESHPPPSPPVVSPAADRRGASTENLIPLTLRRGERKPPGRTDRKG
jgi:hypothetical protein